MSLVILKIFCAYLLGSINGSLVLGRWIGADIRTEGSGNAGGTNALRTHGRLFALGVVVIDVMKAVVAVAWLPALGGASAAALPWIQVGCGAAAVIGHCYPLFFGFRGGKGMATLLGVYAVLAPPVLVVVVLTWIAVVALSGYVGAGTMVGAVAAPVYLIIKSAGIAGPLPTFALAMAALIVYTHRGNISRMRRGMENRMFRPLTSRRH